MQRSSIEISDRGIAKRPLPQTWPRFLTKRSLRGAYQILYTIFYFYRDLYKGNEQNLPWHLFLMPFAIIYTDLDKWNFQNLPLYIFLVFFVTLFGVCCPIIISHNLSESINVWVVSQWIGLRENLQETMVFTIKLVGFSCKFSHHPIRWVSEPYPLLHIYQTRWLQLVMISTIPTIELVRSRMGSLQFTKNLGISDVNRQKWGLPQGLPTISLRFYLPNNSLWFHDLPEMVSLAVRYASLNT